MKMLITGFACVLLLTACSSSPHYGNESTPVTPATDRADASGRQSVTAILNRQYRDWRHVPHQLGGLSKKGIDCSGLVYLTYRNKFGIEMPRSTEQQSEVGKAIKQRQLKAGDLVFFKTGTVTRHVGMYIDDGSFLHVSTRKGVMISRLDQSYWKRTYWKARRVL